MSGKPRMNSLKKFEPFWELGQTMYGGKQIMKSILSLMNNTFQDKMLEMDTRIRMVISAVQQD